MFRSSCFLLLNHFRVGAKISRDNRFHHCVNETLLIYNVVFVFHPGSSVIFCLYYGHIEECAPSFCLRVLLYLLCVFTDINSFVSKCLLQEKKVASNMIHI